jgi:hypothetical protein
MEVVFRKISRSWDVRTGNAARYVYGLIHEVLLCNLGLALMEYENLTFRILLVGMCVCWLC